MCPCPFFTFSHVWVGDICVLFELSSAWTLFRYSVPAGLTSSCNRSLTSSMNAALMRTCLSSTAVSPAYTISNHRFGAGQIVPRTPIPDHDEFASGLPLRFPMMRPILLMCTPLSSHTERCLHTVEALQCRTGGPSLTASHNELVRPIAFIVDVVQDLHGRLVAASEP